MLKQIPSRLKLALTTFPTAQGWRDTLKITLGSSILCGGIATWTGFVDPTRDFDVSNANCGRVLGAFIFPSLLEEVVWRGALVPHPAMTVRTQMHNTVWMAMGVLVVHVLVHPLIGESGLWERGRTTFRDVRFLVLATIVLGGATASYLVTGGSVYAASVAHAVPLILWRDFFGGERRLMGYNTGIV